MAGDATLDTFDGSATDDGESECEDDFGTRPQTGDEPARSTYAWSPDGTPCGECGTVVERCWRDGDELVCEDCKDW